MIRGVVSHGVVVPREPLPAEWKDGMEVMVEKPDEPGAAGNEPHGTDAWMDEVESIARQGDPADDERLELAIKEARCREKELAQKRLGKAS
jgi:hypothetical protein